MLSTWLANHQAEIWSLVTVVFGAVVARLTRLRPKLFYSVGHSSNLLVDQPLRDAEGNEISARQLVRTASITVGNGGLQAAKSVEVTFAFRPLILNLWPARAFEEVTSAFDRYSLKFDSLAPGERLTIEIMGINADLPVLTAVRSEDCTGKLIRMELQKVYPHWFNVSAFALLVLGAAAAVFLIIQVIMVIAAHA